MPYHGKPSQGCERCRRRRVRCDLRAGGCAKCEAAGYDCPGYRDMLNVLFRDQTQHVIRKASSASDSATASQSTPTSQSSQHTPGAFNEHQFQARPSLNDPRLLAAPLGDKAFSFFLTHNVAGPVEPSFATSYFAYTPDDAPKVALACGMRAVGCGELCAIGHSEDTARHGKAEYIRAIKWLNLALRSAKHVKSDEVLLTILVLSMYETVVCEAPRSLEAWSSHIQGAAALLEARGPAQFDRPEGTRLFIQVVFALMTKNARYGLRLPEQLLALAAVSTKFTTTRSVRWRIFKTRFLITNFYSDVTQQRLIDPDQILKLALEFDQEIVSIADDVEEEMQYDIVTLPVDEIAGVPSRQYHFPNYFSSQIWCGIWAARFRLHDVIYGLICMALKEEITISTTDVSIHEREESSATILRSLIEHILASAPQFVSSRQVGQNFLWDNFKHTIHNLDDRPMSGACPLLRMHGGYSFIWCLWLAGNAQVVSAEAKAQIVELLQGIGNEMAARQATLLADALEAGRSPKPWYRQN